MKGFWKGLITGLVIALVAVLFYVFVSSIFTNLGNFFGVSTGNYSSIDNKLESIEDILKEEYYEDVDGEKLKVEALKGFVDGLGDPYTVYYTPSEFNDFTQDIDGTYEGIGAYMGYGESEDEIIVVSPIEDSPAEAAGLKAGDIIKKVDGLDVVGYTTDQLVKIIKGPAGTDVTLTVLRGDEMIDVKITRAKVTIPTVKSEMKEDKIGYIRLSGFDGVSYDQFKEHFDRLNEEGMQGIIVDLRYNPGGLTNIVTDIVDEFLPADMTVYYTENKAGEKDIVKTKNAREFKKPVVILINEGSASASEIMSGAMKDYGRAKLVGTTTFGKGLVQQTFFLKDGSAVKVTIAKYFTPNGNYIHGTGIEPDIEVKWPELKEGEKYPEDFDPQLDVAIEEIKKELK